MRQLLRARARAVILAVVVASLAVGHLMPAEAAPRARKPRTTVLPAVGEQVGVTDAMLLWQSPTELARSLDNLVNMGSTWVRVDFPWSAVQWAGRDSWDWTPIDRFVDAARTRNLKVLALLGHAPDWARRPGTPAFSVPTDTAAFAHFARTAVERYSTRGVKAWEVWNEPNLRAFWGEAPDVAAYSDLLVQTSAAIKAADPSATVVSAGLAPAVDQPGESISPLAFLIGMYQSGAGPSFDALGMHPYSFPYPAMTPEGWNTFYIQPWAALIMSWFGDKTKKIWATEIGWPTGTSNVSVSEDLQATRLTDAIRAWRNYAFDGPLFIYTYRDLGSNSRDWYQNLGLYRFDGTAKPSVAVLRDFLRTRLAT